MNKKKTGAWLLVAVLAVAYIMGYVLYNKDDLRPPIEITKITNTVKPVEVGKPPHRTYEKFYRVITRHIL